MMNQNRNSLELLVKVVDMISFNYRLDYKTVCTNRGSRFTLNIDPKTDGTLDPYEETVLKSLSLIKYDDKDKDKDKIKIKLKLIKK